MRRYNILLTALCFLTLAAQSQVNITKGSFVGVGFSAFKSGYGRNFLPKINAGMFAKVRLFDELGIRPEFAYSQRGDRSNTEAVIIEYIDFSLLADYKYVLHEVSGFSVHAMVGPMWSRMFQASHEMSSGSTTVTRDMYGQTSQTDFGFLFGGGLGINIGGGSLFVDTRLFLGTYELTVPAFGSPMLNRTISFVTGFEF